MILLPKYTDIYNKEPMTITFGRSGAFRYVMRDLMGNIVYETDWDSNLILDTGLDNMGNTFPYSVCHVGDDNTAPIVTHTALLGYLDAADISGSSSEWAGSPNWEYSGIYRYRFLAGDATGTIREIGLTNATEPSLTCRSLVTPEIVKGVDNVLDCYYKVTTWPPLGDVNSTVVLDGLTYDTLLRSANLDNVTINDNYLKMSWSNSGGSNAQRCFDGDIGTNLEQPSGTTITNPGTLSEVGYVNGNHYADLTMFSDLDKCNLDLGLRSLLLLFTGGHMQVQFNRQGGGGERVPKDNTKTLLLTWRLSWARH